MNRVQFVLGSLLLGGILIFGFYGLFVHAQDTEEYQKNPAYIEECGACHLAYPPGLMPSKTWDKVMTGLSDHFGENAELDDETAQLIMSYLQQESLRPGKPTVMSEMLRKLPQNPPLRMTEFPAFLAAHEIIGEQLEMDSFPKGFLSPCADCHRQAADGIFEKDRMHPGYGPSNWGGAPSSNR